MRLFRKKEVSEELSDSAIDDIKNSVNEVSQAGTAEASEVSDIISITPQTEALKQKEQKRETRSNKKEESGYFKNLVKTVTTETEDLDKLSSWYKNKFLPGDMVFQMREYWEKQQPELVLKNASEEIKIKLLGKTERLHALEKEWQEVYFALLSKEEEIRKEEKDLKDSLAEFIETLQESSNKKDAVS